jgi:hypothetical protein
MNQGQGQKLELSPGTKSIVVFNFGTGQATVGSRVSAEVLEDLFAEAFSNKDPKARVIIPTPVGHNMHLVVSKIVYYEIAEWPPEEKKIVPARIGLIGADGNVIK